jgi:dienelactone hydrolase
VSALRVALVVVLLLVACGRPALHRGQIASTRTTLEGGLCKDAYRLQRPPFGRFDVIGVVRYLPCASSEAPSAVVLYLPGTHMTAHLALEDVRSLVDAGVHVWGMDYRSANLPEDAIQEGAAWNPWPVSPEDLAKIGTWTTEVFAGDAAAVVSLVRVEDRGPLYVAGFSFGATLGYRLAADGVPMDGLVILDGVPPDEHAATEGTGPAIDLGSSRLSFTDRRRLLAAVRADPAGPSPVPGFATAGDALTEIVHGARAFGGNGGLSAVKSDRTDVRALARLLSTYKRWWPRAATADHPVSPRPVPRLLAFATGNMGPAWSARVRAGARAFGGDQAEVRELDGYGHVDVFVARDAHDRVWAPIHDFLIGRPG